MDYAKALVLIFGLLSAAVADDDPLCAGVPPDEIYLFPYVGDCSKFWECDNGQKVSRSCPDGLWFNEAMQSCDYPENSGCTENPTTPHDTTMDPRCDGDNTDYFPYPTDCTKYIECYSGGSFVMECPSGLWFNSRDKRCENADDSGCAVTIPTQEPTTEKPTTEKPTTHEAPPTWTTPSPICWGVRPGQTVLKPYPGDCNKFWECSGASMTEMHCPPGLFFSEERQICDWPTLVECDPTTVTYPTVDPTATTDVPPTTEEGTDDPRCADGNTTYWPHPAQCSKYIECYHGKGYEMDCPAGLYFDDTNKLCLDQDESDCGKTTVTPDPNASTTTPDPDVTPDPDCPMDGGRYLYPYPKDCTKFWECSQGRKIERVCPAGLYFNPILLICDYPYEAGCEWDRRYRSYRHN